MYSDPRPEDSGPVNKWLSSFHTGLSDPEDEEERPWFDMDAGECD